MYASAISQPCADTIDSECNCTHCFCKSTNPDADDFCGNFITATTSFYVTVFAFADYAADGTKATIVFRDVQSVDELRK